MFVGRPRQTSITHRCDVVSKPCRQGHATPHAQTIGNIICTNDDVRQFAQELIDDHTRANDQLTQLAQLNNITLPADLTAEQQATYDNIAGMSGADFDKAYMSHNVLVHAASVPQAWKQAEAGLDADIQTFAVTSLPMLAEHLLSAGQIYESIEPSLLFAAFQDGRGELLLSALALQQSSNAKVRQFAQTMINDHIRASNDVTQLAANKNIVLPLEISPEQLRDYVRLSQLAGPAFDSAYMRRNIDVHTKDVERFQASSTNERDSDIRQFAATTLPLLSAHLQAARQIQQRLDPGTQ